MSQGTISGIAIGVCECVYRGNCVKSADSGLKRKRKRRERETKRKVYTRRETLPMR